jgi:hypothetical protein
MTLRRRKSSIRMMWEIGEINQRLDAIELKLGGILLIVTRIFGEEKDGQ